MKQNFQVLISLLMIITIPLSAAIVPVGLGSYTTTLPAGQNGPSNQNEVPVSPKVVAGFTKPIITHKWWSSLMWEYDPTNPYSQNLFAYPISAIANAQGLSIGYTTTASVTPDIVTGQGWKSQEYHYNLQPDLTIGVANLTSPNTQVADYSDWTVTAQWQANNRSLQITLGRGLPFAYCKISGDNAKISCVSTPTIWYNQNGTIGLTINNKNYGIFAPRGSTWQGTSILESNLSGKNYFSVAVLPDNTVNTLLFFQKHAYAFVTDTTAVWNYNQSTSQITTTFTATTQLQESYPDLVNQPLMALYRHQWLHTNAPTTAYTYASARGVMKVIDASSFTTTMTFNGILPTLPLVAKDGQNGYSSSQLYNYVDQIYKQSYATRWENVVQDYWVGKALGRIAQLTLIADQVNHTAARDLFLSETKGKLQQWYEAVSNDGFEFYYDKQWQTIIGFPASYGSNDELNDHHFHWGYFIMASAVIAHFDSTWPQVSNWGGMVELLIQDAQNWDRTNTQFPFLRQFDVYEGHSYANGPELFGAGNNQESSSESINFSAATFLWGAATNNNAIRDLGIYLYTTEAAAIQEYWFDVEQVEFPAGFTKPTLGMIWGNGGAYAIWWAGTVEEVHGINFTPITAASLHLGHYPSYLARNQAYMLTNHPNTSMWPDIHMPVRALYDPAGAISQYNNNPNYTSEFGETHAHTYHWIFNVAAMGEVDPTVTANTPSYAVFNKNGSRTYAAYNYSQQPITVTFSDGKQLQVPARAMANSSAVTPPPPPPPSGDFTQTATRQTNAWFIQFTPTSVATFVDLHYLVNGANQQNVRMLNNNGVWSWTIPNLKSGDVITYFYTYTKKGLGYNSQWFTLTM